MLTTRRLILRSFTAADFIAFSRLLADPRTMAAFGGPWDGSRAKAELDEYLAHERRHGFAPRAVLHDGDLIGDMGLQRLEGGKDVELVYRFLPAAWRHGFATEAGRAILDDAFDRLGLGEVIAVIADDNGASLALAEQLGFERAGEGVYYGKRLGRYRVEASRE